MSDIATVLIAELDTFRFDWAMQGPALLEDDGLQTAVILSLFTDRRAADDDLPTSAQPEDRRGWWGDSFADVAGDQIGSRLWLLAREKQTQATLLKARDFAREALAWLVDDGVARSVSVETSWMAERSGVLVMAIEIARAAKPVSRYQFQAFWRGV
jgi:phage gp46-like protein